MNLIRIGTRGSKLALWQANFIAEKLLRGGWNTRIVTIDTRGDKILDVSIAKIGSKGVFTEEIEEELLEGGIDIAVHSAKDLQSDLGEDFEIVAFTEREDARDVLISDSKFSLNENVTVGTSSTRRTALIKHYYPNFKIVPVRGNLQTRLRKMEEGVCDALLLAWAGVHRMGYGERVRHKLSMEEFVPPVGQGTVAVECARGLSPKIKQAIRKLVNDPETEYCLKAERAFLRELEGGCSIPVFCHAVVKDGQIHMDGGIVSLDGQSMIRRQENGPFEMGEEMGKRLAEQVLTSGGKEILEDVRRQINSGESK